MKKSNIALCIALAVLTCVGWASVIGNAKNIRSEYEGYVSQANVYQEKRLYQKAIACYENALAISDTQEIREQWVQAYQLAYQDGVATSSEYAGAMLELCEKSPETVSYWERILSFYLGMDDYNSAYRVYKKCVKADVESQTLTALKNQLLYAYVATGKAYTDYIRSAAGFYTVYDGKGWGVIDFAGDRLASCDYTYLSPYNAEGQVVVVSEKDIRLKSSDGIVEAIIADGMEKSGAFGNGLLPVYAEGSDWRYLQCESGKYLAGAYEEASNYQNGVAAVKTKEGWYLVNCNGEKVSDGYFDDVKLHKNGDYTYDNVMIASQHGRYGIYSGEGELIQELDCVDADIYLGGLIAVQNENGKWCYVNKDGTVAVDVVFENAKSFSAGLAAVNDGTAWGFINEAGTEVIECTFLEADYFTLKGVCFVSTEPEQYHLIKLRFVEE